MIDEGNRRIQGPSRLRAAARVADRILPKPAVQLLADEVVDRIANRLRNEDRFLAVDTSDAAFMTALLGQSTSAAGRIIAQQRRDGVPLEKVYLETLARSVRKLGEMWDNDQISFIGMTVAIGRVFEIMRHLRQEVPPRSGQSAGQRSILLATVPGDDHSVGATMAAALLRNAGWQVSLGVGLDHDAFIERARQDDSPIIGLSAANGESAVALARAVVALRIEKPQTLIVIGGRITEKEPDLNVLLNVDLVAPPTGDFVSLLEALIKEAPPAP